MKKSKRILTGLFLAALLISALCVPAFALTESEVQAQVAATSREAVTGNVLIWFLCAVAFLKVSQKIDSFMASMGVNVGRTGGSLMAEALIAARGVSMLVKAGGGAVSSLGRAAGGASGGAAAGSSGTTGGFFKGGLIGMAGRHITNSAVKTATSQTAAVHTVQKQSNSAAVHTASSIHSSGNTNNATHTASSVHSAGSTGNPIPTAGPVHSGGDTGSSVPSASPLYSGNIPDGAAPTAGIENVGGSDPAAQPVEQAGGGTQPETTVFSDALTQQEGVIITGSESQSAVHSENSSQVSQTSSTQAVHTSSPGERVHTENSGTGSIPNHGKAVQPSYSSPRTVHQTSIGGAVFVRSLASGGKFANDVIGTVAKGDIRSTGSITGDLAAQSLSSYMGYTALGPGAQDIPRYSDVEIGGGRITGTETPAGSQEGVAFGMYHAAQYTAPEGPYEKVYSADNTLWYKQYAQDSVERKPYKAPDGAVAYEVRIVKKLPAPPKRKDRI